MLSPLGEADVDQPEVIEIAPISLRTMIISIHIIHPHHRSCSEHGYADV